MKKSLINQKLRAVYNHELERAIAISRGDAVVFTARPHPFNGIYQ